MSGMNMGQTLQTGNQFIISAFTSSLFHQLLLVLLLLAALAIGWNILRTTQYKRAVLAGGTHTAAPSPTVGSLLAEPTARRVLRISFGLLWLFDGILQAQSSMPLGMTSGVLQPAASGSPGWVVHLVNIGVTIWSNHPIPAAVASVWIQVGIGLFLLVGPRGRWTQAAGLVSVGWGLLVWGFGEAFGGIFAPGVTWAFGAPGAVLFYVAAGILIALPERSWESRRLGRGILGTMGAFFLGMAVLQAWPGRGFWQGQVHGSTVAGSLTGMIQQMAQTPQPGFLSSWVAWFGRVDAAHGWAVNLVLVACLTVVGIGFLSGKPALARKAMFLGAVLCFADWVLIEDFGFFGGVGTDPNSMIPMALLFIAGYIAWVHLPVKVEEGASTPLPTQVRGGTWWDRLDPTYALRALAATAAVGIVLIGAIPMLLASTNPNADPVLAEALDGVPTPIDTPAPSFTLVNQRNQPVSLASLRGHTAAITFLDPVCNSDCPVIAQEFKEANSLLGAAGRTVDFIAVVANPLYKAPVYLNAFDQQEGLNGMANWQFLTGSQTALQQAWSNYGITVQTEPAGAMVAHSELTYVIDPTGHTRVILNQDQGTGSSDQSSFAVLLANQITLVEHS
jgi:cytochrome oxidase Cu insertion factor (SCO1/SenC/PrrC family)